MSHFVLLMPNHQINPKLELLDLFLHLNLNLGVKPKLRFYLSASTTELSYLAGLAGFS